MSEYIITKRTECDTCHGEQQYIYSKDAPDTKFALACPACRGIGHYEVKMDADEWLLDRLAKLRWDENLDEYRGTTNGEIAYRLGNEYNVTDAAIYYARDAQFWGGVEV